jgi:glucose/arabinose dehydrogenase
MIDRRVRGVYRRASVVRPTAVSSFVVPSFVVALILVGAAPVCVAQSSQNAATPKVQSDGCAADNGGITLSPGFCATVFADNLGHARQMVFGPDGTLYVNTWSGTYYHNDKGRPGGFLIALKDSKGDGHAESGRALRSDSGARLGRRHRHSHLQQRSLRRTERQDHPLSAADQRHRADGKSAGHCFRPAAHRRSSDASIRHR